MSLNKRLNRIEERLNPPKKPTAWIARIRKDGRVILSHEGDEIELPDVDALCDWENQRGGLPAIRIEYV